MADTNVGQINVYCQITCNRFTNQEQTVKLLYELPNFITTILPVKNAAFTFTNLRWKNICDK